MNSIDKPHASFVFPAMKLTGLLHPKNIIPDLKAKDRWQAIEELLDQLISHNYVEKKLRAEILSSLQQRENMISTAVGAGVAIPHAFSEHLQDVVAAFGKSTEGIDFESQDGENTHFVILFISPKASYQKHLLALAAIARHFTREDTRRKLMSAKTSEEIHSLLCFKKLSDS